MSFSQLTKKKIFLTATFVCESFLIVVLIVSSLIHLSGPFFFLESALRYRVLEAAPLSMILPVVMFLQLGLAASMIIQFAPRTSLLITAAMFLTFSFLQISVLLRGIKASCWCYGSASGLIDIGSILQLLILVAICLILAFFKFSENAPAPGVDHV